MIIQHLAQECSKWGGEAGTYFIGKWSHDGVPVYHRLYDHPLFVDGKAHWIVPFVQGGRLECDDFYTVHGFTRLTGDFLKIYVR